MASAFCDGGGCCAHTWAALLVLFVVVGVVVVTIIIIIIIIRDTDGAATSNGADVQGCNSCNSMVAPSSVVGACTRCAAYPERQVHHALHVAQVDQLRHHLPQVNAEGNLWGSGGVAGGTD